MALASLSLVCDYLFKIGHRDYNQMEMDVKNIKSPGPGDRMKHAWRSGSRFFEQVFDLFGQVIDVEGLDQIIIGAGADRDNFTVGVVERCHDQNGGLLESWVGP